MSREDDDARLYNCSKKYEEIVKQVMLLDELTDAMDPRSRSSKPKKAISLITSGLREVVGSSTLQNNFVIMLLNCLQNSSTCSTGNGATNASQVADQESLDQLVVQTITKFLRDLNTSSIQTNSKSPSDQ